MFESRKGQKVPQITSPFRVDGEWQKVSTVVIFKRKTAELFAVPGAFRPTCSNTNVPRYDESATNLKANGVYSVVCLAVNDPYAMENWQHEQQEQHAGGIDFLPDGNTEFKTGMDMMVMPFYHPKIEDDLRTGLRDLNQHLHIGVGGLHDCINCWPGT